MIQLKDITIGYGKKVIAERLNARLKRGSLTCLVGRNGVGKSTLLRTLVGFQSALSGDIIIGDRLLGRMTQKEIAHSVSVVLTGRPDIQMMTVKEVVGLGRAPYTDMWGSLREEDLRVVDDSLSKVGIEQLAERRIDTLSDGECQKVMIAKALAQQTPVIVLDEPTAYLDYPSKVETMMLMKDIASAGNGAAVLMSTHDMEMALHLADELWLMTKDHRLITGTPDDLHDTLVEEKLKLSF